MLVLGQFFQLILGHLYGGVDFAAVITQEVHAGEQQGYMFGAQTKKPTDIHNHLSR